MGEDAGPMQRAGHVPARRHPPREVPLAQEISIEFTRFSAFYSPLIATMAGGFLKEEGLDGQASRFRRPASRPSPACSTAPCTSPSRRPRRASGRSSRARSRRRCTSPRSTRRTASSSPAAAPTRRSRWDKLKGKKVIVDHGGQPMAMFKYACFKKGLDFKAIHGHRCRLHRQDDRGLPQGRRRLHPPAGTGAAAARARRRRPHRRRARRCHRAVRLLEPRRHARVARHRHGQALHARLPQGARLADRHARRRGRQGRGALLQGHRSWPC